MDLRGQLDALYERYNRREFVAPDPLQVLYEYDDAHDREVAGFIASALAFGNVKAIIRSVGDALRRMGPPAAFARQATCRDVAHVFGGFKHRWADGGHLCELIRGIGGTLERHGSLHACFASHVTPGDDTVIPPLTRFVEEIRANSNGRSEIQPGRRPDTKEDRRSDTKGDRRSDIPVRRESCHGCDSAAVPNEASRNACPTMRKGRPNPLLSCPSRGSACKRLHLYLRWMVRRDAVDPGGWEDVPASMLVVPLDVHMHRVARRLGLTRRKQADRRTALEVTAAFRELRPDDPVRYDFALTRLGIRRIAEL